VQWLRCVRQALVNKVALGRLEADAGPAIEELLKLQEVFDRDGWPGLRQGRVEVMRGSDLANALERQIGGKLDVRFELKAGLEPDERIDGRLRAYFTKEIHRSGADIHMRVRSITSISQLSTSGCNSESRILTTNIRTSGSGSASRDRRTEPLHRPIS